MGSRQGTRQHSSETARNNYRKVKRTIVELLALLARQDLLGLRLGDALELEFGPQRLRSRLGELRSRNELRTCGSRNNEKTLGLLKALRRRTARGRGTNRCRRSFGRALRRRVHAGPWT
jgi:hypothetical protein